MHTTKAFLFYFIAHFLNECAFVYSVCKIFVSHNVDQHMYVPVNANGGFFQKEVQKSKIFYFGSNICKIDYQTSASDHMSQ